MIYLNYLQWTILIEYNLFNPLSAKLFIFHKSGIREYVLRLFK